MKMVQFCVPLLLFSKATRATNCMFLLWGLLDMFMYFHWPFVVEKWQFSRVSGIICAPFSRGNNIRWYEQKVQERKEMKKQLSGVFIFALTFGSAFAAIHMNAKKEFPLKSMREKGMTIKLRNENVNALGYFWHSTIKLTVSLRLSGELTSTRAGRSCVRGMLVPDVREQRKRRLSHHHAGVRQTWGHPEPQEKLLAPRSQAHI